MLLQDQVQPDKIKLLTPQQVAALGPLQGRGARRRVRRMGAVLATADRTRALAELEPLALGRLVSQKRVEFDSGYWVGDAGAVRDSRRRRGPHRGVARAGRARARDRRRRQGQFTVAFGVFRTEDSRARARGRARRGTASSAREGDRAPAARFADAGRRARSPANRRGARLRELQASQYRRRELKITACERA